jgi:outer membrane protein OmpA-like peptidoglycan-associated protein
VYFASGKSEVLPQSYNELIRLKTMMERHPDIRIELRGHTDDQGTYSYNQKLSEARARAVAEFLIEKGISRQRLTWVGFGESLPTGDNSTEQGRQSNRRVEYRILAD